MHPHFEIGVRGQTNTGSNSFRKQSAKSKSKPHHSSRERLPGTDSARSGEAAWYRQCQVWRGCLVQTVPGLERLPGTDSARSGEAAW